jgi:hypothetical protein
MQIYFCDRCSCRITEGDLAKKDAFEFGTLTFCIACWNSEQVQEIVRQKSELLAAVTEGGAGAVHDGAHAQTEHKVSRKSPPRPNRGAGSSGRHRKARRIPSPRHLRAAEHDARRAPRRRFGYGIVLLAFGAAAAVAFLLLMGILMFTTGDRGRGSAQPTNGAGRHSSMIGPWNEWPLGGWYA